MIVHGCRTGWPRFAYGDLTMPRPTIVPMLPRNSEAPGVVPHAPQRFLSLRDVLGRLT